MIDYDILEAFLIVRAFCMSSDDCSNCPLYKKGNKMDCQNAPFTWDITQKEGE